MELNWERRGQSSSHCRLSLGLQSGICRVGVWCKMPGGGLNDGSTNLPKLRIDLKLDNLTDLPADSIWRRLTGSDLDERLLADGLRGIQLTTDEA